MKKVKLSTSYRKLLADTLTPVSIYLKLRDKFANSILLESSDYHGNDNTFSYICFQPMASFTLQSGQISIQLPGREEKIHHMAQGEEAVITSLTEFVDTFEVDPDIFNFPQNGLFGYTCYDSVRYFEDLDIQHYADENYQIPDMLYQVYQYIIAIDHYKNELYLFCHDYEAPTSSRKLDEIVDIINNLNIPAYGFQLS
ncbi:MAG: anthranilate synthase component I family protein, partial [Bacteroidota bacterium]